MIFLSFVFITIFEKKENIRLKSLVFYISIVLAFTYNTGQAQSDTLKMIVQLQPGISSREVQIKFNHTHNNFKIFVAEELAQSMNIWSYYVVHNGLSKTALRNELYEMPEIAALQYNQKISFRNTIPNDPDFSFQWNLLNDGSSGGTTDADIDADLAWKYGIGDTTRNGDTIVIAVVDGGFDLLHEDLSFWKNKREIPNDLLDNDNNGYIDDYDGWNIEAGNGNPHTPNLNNGHATAVCGAAAAVGNNNKGIAGVAYGTKILPIHLGTVYADSVVKAYDYVIKMRQLYNSSKGDSGAFIVAVNSSFGLSDSPSNNAVWCNMYDLMGNIGIVSTVAAPNDFKDYDIKEDVPGNCASNFLINTTNSNNKDEISNAAYGKTNIDIAAPATGIYITKTGSAYATWTGTSFAAPQVAGAIAMLYSAACDSILKLCQSKPDQGVLLMRDFILKNAESKASFQDILSSNGRLNLFSSLTALKSYCGEAVPHPSLGSKLQIYWTSYNSISKTLFIHYDFPKASKATFYIYDVTGKKIIEYSAENLTDGNYTGNIPDLDLSSGFYFINLEANNALSTAAKFVVD